MSTPSHGPDAPAFRAWAIEVGRTRRLPRAQLGRDRGSTVATLRLGVTPVMIDAGRRAGLTSDARAAWPRLWCAVAVLPVARLQRHAWPTRAATRLTIVESIAAWSPRQRRLRPAPTATPAEDAARAREPVSAGHPPLHTTRSSPARSRPAPPRHRPRPRRAAPAPPRPLCLPPSHMGRVP